jgi:hypothetical protein
MGVLADTLGGKIAGELIRATDWNALIDAIEAIEVRLDDRITELSTSVDTRFEAVNTSLTELQETVESLDERVTGLRTDLDELRGRLRRVTMEAARSSFAIGELAQITARISDLDGTALPLPDPATRPWIDFVTVWGQMKPAPGFVSRGGAGDRTISVQVNAEGIARVLLRAEHADGISDEAEAEVSATLTTAVAQSSVLDIILQSNTPMEAQERGAFRIMSAEYARNDALSVRNYVDTYYVRNPGLVNNNLFFPEFHHRWRDYRATVMAFAKSDSDPLTPDSSLGSCSIQINFRDWIGPWINLDFFADVPILVDNYRDRFGGLIRNDYRDTLIRFEEDIEVLVGNVGLVGKQKQYRAINEAIGRVQVSNPPTFLPDLTLTLQSGIALQQAAEYGQTAAIGMSQQPIVFQAFAETGAKADTRAAEVAEEVSGRVETQLGQAREELVFQVQREQANFRTDLLAESGPILNVQRELQTVAGQVQGFQLALNGKADIQTLARFLPG